MQQLIQSEMEVLNSVNLVSECITLRTLDNK